LKEDSEPIATVGIDVGFETGGVVGSGVGVVKIVGVGSGVAVASGAVGTGVVVAGRTLVVGVGEGFCDVTPAHDASNMEIDRSTANVAFWGWIGRVVKAQFAWRDEFAPTMA
jgi:hypothetical protein